MLIGVEYCWGSCGLSEVCFLECMCVIVCVDECGDCEGVEFPYVRMLIGVAYCLPLFGMDGWAFVVCILMCVDVWPVNLHVTGG